MVNKAIKQGTLDHPRRLQCVDCDNPAWCYDHRDYRKPLEVQPICQGCNNRRGAALPLPTSADGLATKRPVIDGVINSGNGWSKIEGGEGYSPTECLFHAEAVGPGVVDWDSRHNDLSYSGPKDRYEFFKQHDPYSQDGYGFALGVTEKAPNKCWRGHSMTAPNLYISPKGGRMCRACNSLSSRKYYQRSLERDSA